MVFYGLAYSSSDFGGNPYLNFFLGYITEIPTVIICQVSQHLIGRRMLLSFFYLVSGAALLANLAIPSCEFYISINDYNIWTHVVFIAWIYYYKSFTFISMAWLCNISAYSGAYIITLSLNLIGRLSALGAFIMIYLYTAEVLPTVVRSVGFGTASATARIGGISAQYLMGLVSTKYML